MKLKGNTRVIGLQWEARSFFEDALPNHAKTYILSIISIGIPILLYSIYHTLIYPDRTWLYLVGLAIVTTSFPVLIHSMTNARIWVSLSDVFVFFAVFYFSAEVAVVVAAIEAVTFNLRMRKQVVKLNRHLFNLTQIVITAFLVSRAVYFLQGQAALPLDQLPRPCLEWLLRRSDNYEQVPEYKVSALYKNSNELELLEQHLSYCHFAEKFILNYASVR